MYLDPEACRVMEFMVLSMKSSSSLLRTLQSDGLYGSFYEVYVVFLTYVWGQIKD